jgi:hypothetical protein
MIAKTLEMGRSQEYSKSRYCTTTPHLVKVFVLTMKIICDCGQKRADRLLIVSVHTILWIVKLVLVHESKMTWKPHVWKIRALCTASGLPEAGGKSALPP